MTHIVLAGATGDLGGRIGGALRDVGVSVTAPVRPGTSAVKLATLQRNGIEPVEVDYNDAAALTKICVGAVCVISALNGLEETIIDTQTKLLAAAVAANVPRFVPSDFSIDYFPLPIATNRNFDLRRRFADHLDTAPIRSTSIFNGAFSDLLHQAPIVFPRLRKVVYWNDADVPIDFTAKDDVAAFTAAVALDPEAPRALHIAGERTSARKLAATLSATMDQSYGLLRAGSSGRLIALSKLTRRVAPQPTAVFPIWQGMQYLHSMFSGLAGSPALDNDRYPGMKWSGVAATLTRSRPTTA